MPGPAPPSLLGWRGSLAPSVALPHLHGLKETLKIRGLDFFSPPPHSTLFSRALGWEVGERPFTFFKTTKSFSAAARLLISSSYL